MTRHFWLSVACLLGMMDSSRADLLWGVNGHPFTAYPNISIKQQLDYLKDLGLKSYRVNVPDAGRAPELAELVKEAGARGITILPVLTPADVDLKKDSTEELYRKSYEFAEQIVRQFKDQIPVWELGNELENYAIIKPCEMRDNGKKYPCEWGPASGEGPLDYYGPRWAKVSAVLKGLSDGVISVDPKIRKALGTAGWGHVGAFKRMQEDGIQWDISVWHTYGQDPRWAFQTLARYGHPIWVTEFNQPYGSQRGDDLQAQGLEEMMTRLRELQDTYSVEAAFVYELLDESYWAPNFEAYMGLVRLVATDNGGWRTGEPKPAYAKVKQMVRGSVPAIKPQRDCDLASAGAQGSLSDRKVAYNYCLIVGAIPDETVRATWVSSLEKGDVDVTEMALKLLSSDAFNSRYPVYGVSDRTFVNFLFELLLDRDADSNGLASYVKQLNQGLMSRASVAHSILTSEEFRSKHELLFESKGAMETSETSPG